MAAAGAALYVYAFRQYYRTDAGVLYAVIQWMVSGFLILGFGGNFLLDAVKRRQGFYYRRILQIRQTRRKYDS